MENRWAGISYLAFVDTLLCTHSPPTSLPRAGGSSLSHRKPSHTKQTHHERYLATHPMGQVSRKTYTLGKTIALKGERHGSGFLPWTENLHTSAKTENNVARSLGLSQYKIVMINPAP